MEGRAGQGGLHAPGDRAADRPQASDQGAHGGHGASGGRGQEIRGQGRRISPLGPARQVHHLRTPFLGAGHDVFGPGAGCVCAACGTDRSGRGGAGNGWHNLVKHTATFHDK